MKYFIVCLTIFITTSSFTGSTVSDRLLKEVQFQNRGYDLGHQHGILLSKEINNILKVWKENTQKSLNKNPDEVIEAFFDYANFIPAIKKWTPSLYEEIRGISEGSGQRFEDIFVLNLLDEFWVYINNIHNHHCSSAGIPAQNGRPGYISQNMDLENYTDGFQVLMRLEETEDEPEQLILTHPGLIALNGLNNLGVGVCVNTLMQLKASNDGLPVAFVIRGILKSKDKKLLLEFIKTVNHASGQNYLIGINNEIFDFEASANHVIRYNPKNKNGSLYHTNHPIVNKDLKPWFENSNSVNSQIRLEAVAKRLNVEGELVDAVFKDALRSKDDENNPVCRKNNHNARGFTFASVIMNISQPSMQIVAGPPDEAKYRTYSFNHQISE